jgi:copper homeostasis protein
LTPNVLLEICAISLDFAVAAQRAGADRVEICRDLACGGVTPEASLLAAAREHLQLPIHVLIRPRAGDFCYSADEFQVMRQDIEIARQLRMDGVVLGLLDRKSQIDVARTRELVEAARPLRVTFHRAFDQSDLGQQALEAVIQTGAERLLTSGGGATAAEGLDALARLVDGAKGRIIVMPGGGITAANVLRIVRATSAREIHGSLLTLALRPADGVQRGSETDLYYERVFDVISLLRGIAPPAVGELHAD